MATNSGPQPSMRAGTYASLRDDPYLMEAHAGFGLCVGTALIFLLVRLLAKWKMAHRWTLEDCKWSEYRDIPQ